MITNDQSEELRQTSDSQFANREGDNSLLISRFLAILAIATVCSAFVWPGSFTMLFAGWAILLMYAVHLIIQEKQKKDVLDKSIVGLFKPLPQSTVLWSVAVSLVFLGVVSSAIMLPASAIDPNEWIRWSFISCLSLISSTYLSWCIKTDASNSLFLGFLNGISVGTAFAALAFFATLCAASGDYLQFAAIGLASVLMLFHSGGSMKSLLLKVDRASSFAVFCSACISALLTFAVGIGPELRSLAIAIGEKLASGVERPQQDLGFKILQTLEAGLDIKQAASLPGAKVAIPTALIPIPRTETEKIYFFLTGKSLNSSSTNNVARASSLQLVPGLSLVESKLTGHVDTNSLTSVTYWTMIFGNQSVGAKEAQAYISLPPNSVVSRVTLWINGVPQEAAFNSTGRVTEAYRWITRANRDPLLVTEVAPGVIHLQASPVPSFGEMKVRIGITTALTAKSKRDFSFTAPKITDSNFAIDDDATTEVKLESNARITSNAKSEELSSENGQSFLNTEIAPKSEHNVEFTAHRATDFTGFTARATHSSEDMVISESIAAPTGKYKKLAIVIEDSKAVNSKLDAIKQALAAVPAATEAKVFIADKRDQFESLSIADAIFRISSIEPSGGIDSADAIQAAKKFLGRQPNGAIVWIHGAKTMLFERDKQVANSLMYSGKRRLKIYDLAVDAGDEVNVLHSYTESINHDAAPEFYSIAQTGEIQKDLSTFLRSSGTEGVELNVVRQKIANKHIAGTSNDFPVASRLSSLWAAAEARKCAAAGDTTTAELLGNVYRVVTPATGAVVMEQQSDYAYQNLNRNFYSVVSKHAKAQVNSADGTSTLDARYANDKPQFDDQQPGASGWAGRQSTRGDAFEAAPRLYQYPTPSPMPSPMASPISIAAPSASPGSAPVLQGATWSGSGDPRLQGATNGTIGPQGDDTTFVTGVSQANETSKMARTESLLNGWTMFAKILGLISGVLFIFKGFGRKQSKSNSSKNLLVGSILLMAGFGVPYLVSCMHQQLFNWLFFM